MLITPAPEHSLKGNRITAIRWRLFLKKLGHRVIIKQDYDGEPCDLMIALHARRSFQAIEQFRNLYRERPMVVVLTGTDLYKDIRTDRNALKSLALADRLVMLQDMGVMELPNAFRNKTRVIYQSAIKPKGNIAKRRRTFDVCVIGHLRPVKDPFRTALAVRQLPPLSNVRVLHLGAALDIEMEQIARKEMARNPRYHWLGLQPHWKTLRILAASQILVLSSRIEGGANVVSEAVISGVPVLATKISGAIGMLGKDYPGYFPIGDTKGLRALIIKAENDPEFLERLKQWGKSLTHRFEPESEESSLKELLKEFDIGL